MVTDNPEIVELDLNPLSNQQDEGYWVVDSRVSVE
jgi:hypothetical protein